MHDFCIDLNLEIPLLVDHRLVTTTGLMKQHKRVSIDIINPDLIKLFYSKGLLLTFVESFYTPKITRSPIHEDGEENNDVLKLNWVYGGEGSTMNWYEPIENPVWKKTVLGGDYKFYDPDKVRLIHSQAVGKPSLLQVGIPHNVTTGDANRFCVSIVPFDISSKKYITFNQGIELFKEYINH
jgi:hypothetical protein